MNRLRTQSFRQNVLPLVLAALALRALVPAGFMPTANGELRFMTQLCSTQAPGRFESAKLPPGDVPTCEYCVAPLLGAPLVQSTPAVVRAAISFESTTLSAQIPSSPLTRAFGARAPPA